MNRKYTYLSIKTLLCFWQNYKINVKSKENNRKQVKHVRDVIPHSRLAEYGNYEYDEEREKMYNTQISDCEATFSTNPELISEPWMLAEVEKLFLQLTAPESLVS